MSNILMMIEVAGKQSYIFGCKKLRDNAMRSKDIAYITSVSFLESVDNKLFNKEDNLVYSGGGHIILQFRDKDLATKFAKIISKEVLKNYEGLSLFIKQISYDNTLTPSQNIANLRKAIEHKKSLRKSEIRTLNFGIEQNILAKKENSNVNQEIDIVSPPEGFNFTKDFEEAYKHTNDNFLAIVHIDGNAMGKRVVELSEKQDLNDWEEYRRAFQNFSTSIQCDFEQTFIEMAQEVAFYKGNDFSDNKLPIRPVIIAGDDVCFVTLGNLGLECARIFLEKLTKKINKEDNKTYSACAGIAIVHRKFPFFRAYTLSEELCSSAKKFSAFLDETGAVSAIDWHIDYGQAQGSLSELREKYTTEDGNRLELRPLAVINADGQNTSSKDYRSYEFFKGMLKCFRDNNEKIARGKVKELRTTLKQGEVETNFYIIENEIQNILYNVLNAYGTAIENAKEIQNGKIIEKSAFKCFDEISKVKHSLLFDAIEMMDICTIVENEVNK